MAGRPRLPSPRRSNEDYDDDEEEEDGLEREEVPEYVHVYQSLDRQERSLSRVRDDIYAQPLKRDAVQSEGGEETDDSLGIVSPLPKEEIEVQKGAFKKSSTPKLEQSPSSSRSMLTAGKNFFHCPSQDCRLPMDFQSDRFRIPIHIPIHASNLATTIFYFRDYFEFLFSLY